MLSYGYPTAVVTQTHNIGPFSRKVDVTALAGWKGGKRELKGWMDICNRKGSKVEETKSKCI